MVDGLAKGWARGKAGQNMATGKAEGNKLGGSEGRKDRARGVH